MKKILYSILAIALFASCSENSKKDTQVSDAVVTAKIQLSSNVSVSPSNSPMKAGAGADVETDGRISTNFPTGVEKISITNIWKDDSDITTTKDYTKGSSFIWENLHLGINVFTAEATTTYAAYKKIVTQSSEEYRTFKGQLADTENAWLTANQVDFTKQKETFHMHMKGINSMFTFQVNNTSKDKTLEITAKVGNKTYPVIETSTGKYMFNTVDLIAGVNVQFYATVIQKTGTVSTVIVDKQILLPKVFKIGANKKYSFKNVIKVDNNSFPVSGTFIITWEDWDKVIIDNDTPVW